MLPPPALPQNILFVPYNILLVLAEKILSQGSFEFALYLCLLLRVPSPAVFM
jgi:hypothetical protein